MVEPKVEFRKIRDFGEVLNDTFLFIRQNFKPLIGSFFAVCSIFMIVQAIFAGIYQSQTLSMFAQLRKGGAFKVSNVLNEEYVLLMLSGWLTYIAMKVSLGAYIKFYVENNKSRPGIEDVWRIFKKYYFKVAVYTLPIVLLQMVGYVFCLVPGVYLSVVLIPFDLILMFEDATFGDAFNRCFTIIKENFWISFAVYIVAGLIFMLSSWIISGVVGVLTGLSVYLTTEDISTPVLIVTSFLNIFASAFFIIFYIAVALHFFNLVEQRDGTGILSRIDNIGRNPDNFNNIEEQY